MDPMLQKSIEGLTEDLARGETKSSLIMMVDDEPILLEVVQSMLEERGYERFVTCDDSREVLRLVEEHRPDVLLLDLVMPEVNGFDLLLELRSRHETRHLAVIVLTSSSDAETKLRALDLGATDFLAKPVDPSELSLRLRNTLSAKAYQDQLANLDRLTGLPNRDRFQDVLAGVMRRVARDEEETWLLMLGLVNFKSVNDTLGPSAGDEILTQLSTRLEFALGEHTHLGSGMVARVGGDEFAILLRGWERADATALAEELLEELTVPFRLEGESIYAAAGLGLASTANARTPESLIQQASVAQKHAKRTMPNSMAFYSSEIDAEAKELLLLENDLRSAIDRDEFELHYQPKIDSITQRTVGVEALIRWDRAGTMESPARFIPLAESSGLIVELGAWVVREACRQGKALERAGHDLKISVNVSSRQLTAPGFVACVQDALRVSGLAPEKLVVEITESMIIDDVDACLEVLEGLCALGVMLSVDDFGTGYSSLSYLARMPIGELKIDRSFLRGVPGQSGDVAIVKAIIALARSLDLNVTAEGTETLEQVEFLSGLGCGLLQGFYFSRPLPFDALCSFCDGQDEALASAHA